MISAAQSVFLALSRHNPWRKELQQNTAFGMAEPLRRVAVAGAPSQKHRRHHNLAATALWLLELRKYRGPQRRSLRRMEQDDESYFGQAQLVIALNGQYDVRRCLRSFLARWAWPAGGKFWPPKHSGHAGSNKKEALKRTPASYYFATRAKIHQAAFVPVVVKPML